MANMRDISTISQCLGRWSVVLPTPGAATVDTTAAVLSDRPTYCHCRRRHAPGSIVARLTRRHYHQPALYEIARSHCG